MSTTAPLLRVPVTASKLALPPTIETHATEDYRGAPSGSLRIHAQDVSGQVLKVKKRALGLFLCVCAIGICAASFAIYSNMYEVGGRLLGFFLTLTPVAFSALFVEAVATKKQRPEQLVYVKDGVCEVSGTSERTPLAERLINRRLDGAGGWLVEVLLADGSARMLATGLSFQESLAVERIVSDWVPAALPCTRNA
ncbi:MAG: hypothetical protein AB8H86_20710 [Polyangiales bacterium]